MSDSLAAHQRLILLRELHQLDGMSANDSYLQGVLRGFGLPAGRDQVRDHLAWLAEHELASLDFPLGVDGPLTVELTTTGADVATGVIRMDGVQRPSPHQAGSSAIAASTKLALEKLRRPPAT